MGHHRRRKLPFLLTVLSWSVSVVPEGTSRAPQLAAKKRTSATYCWGKLRRRQIRKQRDQQNHGFEAAGRPAGTAPSQRDSRKPTRAGFCVFKRKSKVGAHRDRGRRQQRIEDDAADTAAFTM